MEDILILTRIYLSGLFVCFLAKIIIKICVKITHKKAFH